jgi:Flp pilus assembly protein TadG
MAIETTSRRPVASERGAIIIQVGVAVLVLSAFAMFVIDYGVLWVSRHQAQNAADAGAIAGATALALDDFDDRSDTGPAKVAARGFALANFVWGESPDVDMDTDVRFYADAPEAFPASCANDDCVRVDVYRNQDRENPLPTFFGWLVGVNDQGVRATATAQAAAGNASDCLKPWAVLDKWLENPGPWTTESEFNPYTNPKDTYIAPTKDSTGTSYTLEDDLGLKVTLKYGDPGDAREEFTAGWFSPVDLGCEVQGGAECYEDAIIGCVNRTWAVGMDLDVKPGNMKGKTKSGTQALIDLDKEATWNEEDDRIEGSCVGEEYTCDEPGYRHSPRLVAVPVVNTLKAYDDLRNENGNQVGAGNKTVRIVAILGFFIESVDKDGNVTGYLATKPDLLYANGGGVNPAAGFIKSVQLVR